MNPVQIARGIEKTSVALVKELRLMSREVRKKKFFKEKRMKKNVNFIHNQIVFT